MGVNNKQAAALIFAGMTALSSPAAASKYDRYCNDQANTRFVVGEGGGKGTCFSCFRKNGDVVSKELYKVEDLEDLAKGEVEINPLACQPGDMFTGGNGGNGGEKGAETDGSRGNNTGGANSTTGSASARAIKFDGNGELQQMPFIVDLNEFGAEVELPQSKAVITSKGLMEVDGGFDREI